jgi:hypothetical protein
VFEAKGVKYLVTSQRREVWPDAKCVLMDKPTIREGRQILARRAKMPNDEIPPKLSVSASKLYCCPFQLHCRFGREAMF